jgi:hypothetical protein
MSKQNCPQLPSFAPPSYVPPPTQPPNQPSNNNLAQAFIGAHNTYRNNVNPPATNMMPIQWSDDLATSAGQWAAKCVWAHSQKPNVGENLYASSVRTPNVSIYDPSEPVNSWGNEKTNFDYNTNTCAQGQVCGHYTQVVWANSNNVGCAVQDCPSISGIGWPNGGTIAVCQYSPPGNVSINGQMQKPYVSS